MAAEVSMSATTAAMRAARSAVSWTSVIGSGIPFARRGARMATVLGDGIHGPVPQSSRIA
ncbi:hypothetical protein Aglo01_63780 [Actinokineospora globicatena]|uniref:Uncharacterized protein n=1 Tax=Actinokineospora globicatena TaxID=103729 RepID=A0A9W6QGP1_9PSEU|nr:hypothetical protein Aglo01_63780 [Actinokineospora globicatena]GLW88691.1 hypothetical protein Aglo02_63300 [Actinokineospora globicatena]GLW89430.1 hypothetical protein Aglo03_02460 [Actinokineospora globicatena]